jgi:hypothetical protein
MEAHIIDNKVKIQTDHFYSYDHVHSVLDRKGDLLVEFLPQGSTINTGIYYNTLKKSASCDPEQATWHA